MGRSRASARCPLALRRLPAWALVLTLALCAASVLGAVAVVNAAAERAGDASASAPDGADAAARSDSLGAFFEELDVNHDGAVDAREASAFIGGAIGGADLDEPAELAAAAAAFLTRIDGGDAGATVDVAELDRHLHSVLAGVRVSDYVRHGLGLPQYEAAFRSHAITPLDFPVLVRHEGAVLAEELGMGSSFHVARVVRAMRRLMLGLGSPPSEPRSVSCNATAFGGGRAALRWEPPASPGVPPLHKYVVERAGWGSSAGQGQGRSQWALAGEVDDPQLPGSWVDETPSPALTPDSDAAGGGGGDWDASGGGGGGRGVVLYRVSAWNQYGRSPYVMATCELPAAAVAVTQPPAGYPGAETGAGVAAGVSARVRGGQQQQSLLRAAGAARAPPADAARASSAAGWHSVALLVLPWLLRLLPLPLLQRLVSLARELLCRVCEAAGLPPFAWLAPRPELRASAAVAAAAPAPLGWGGGGPGDAGRNRTSLASVAGGGGALAGALAAAAALPPAAAPMLVPGSPLRPYASSFAAAGAGTGSGLGGGAVWPAPAVYGSSPGSPYAMAVAPLADEPSAHSRGGRGGGVLRSSGSEGELGHGAQAVPAAGAAAAERLRHGVGSLPSVRVAAAAAPVDIGGGGRVRTASASTSGTPYGSYGNRVSGGGPPAQQRLHAHAGSVDGLWALGAASAGTAADAGGGFCGPERGGALDACAAGLAPGAASPAAARYRDKVCPVGGCGRRLDLLRYRDYARRHYCGRCQQTVCAAHTAYSSHGPTGSCGHESRCVCTACFQHFNPAYQRFLMQRNTLPRNVDSQQPGAGAANTANAVASGGLPPLREPGSESSGGAAPVVPRESADGDKTASKLLWERAATKLVAVVRFRKGKHASPPAGEGNAAAD